MASSESRGAEPRPPSGWWHSHAALVLVVVGFAVVYFFLSLLRFEEFYGTNWDLGINMQLLWSNTHGLLLWEAGDFEATGVKSFLSVHSTYIAIPISYLYAVAPGAPILFAIQAAAVASSAIPIYLIGRRSGLPESWIVAGLAVYLLTFAVLSALLYDFHWEAFIPAEFGWAYYLWSTRRYALAFVPATLGVLTLEVFPFLLIGMVVYFGYLALRDLSKRPAPLFRELRENLPRAWPLLALLAFALVSYVTLRVVENNVIPALVGTHAATLGGQESSGLRQLFGLNASPASLLPSLVYWFLLFAAFGFLPLFVRQSALLLSLPWFWASVVVDPRFSSAFGNQYAFIAVATISVAFIEALAEVHRSAESTEAKALLPVEWLLVVVPFLVIAVLASRQLLQPTAAGEYLLAIMAGIVGAVLALVALSRVRPAGWSRSVWSRTQVIRSPEDRVSYRQSTRFVFHVPRAARSPWFTGLTRVRPRTGPLLGGILVVVVLSNLALSPLSPTNFGATPFPGYRFSFAGNPVYDYIGEVVSAIPANAPVLASDNLFPFVANDVNAYSLKTGSSGGLPHLPFNAAHLPPYVLLSSTEWAGVPSFLADTLFNQSKFGIVSMIYCSYYPCTIYLFAEGYQGPTSLIQVTPFEDTTILCPSSFNLGASGTIVAAAGTRCGSEIASAPAANLSGNGHTVWYGPYLTLLAGSYNVTLSLQGGVFSGAPATANIVLLNGGGYGLPGPWYSFNLNGMALSPGRWTNVSVLLNLPHPVSGVEFRGYLNYNTAAQPPSAYGYVDLNFVQIVRYAA